ncbi:hypothetical protein DPMN_165529 [Dreissena polymorpha]|uniref:Uncharacterized protein n=1 Tax=Dreissena polymorpha TaxID=45954 RepID=A0A9D4EVH3_DREPO|nr:hypothetical protein DPMN_165529 [Dreissena polymorpha]
MSISWATDMQRAKYRVEMMCFASIKVTKTAWWVWVGFNRKKKGFVPGRRLIPLSGSQTVHESGLILIVACTTLTACLPCVRQRGDIDCLPCVTQRGDTADSLSTQVDPSRPKSTQVDPSRPTSTQVDPSQPKSTKVNPSRPKSTQVNPSRPKSTQVDPSRPKSTKVNPSRPKSTQSTQSTQVNLSRPKSTQ